MKIWIFHNNSTLPEHGHFTRAYCFGKYLERQGDEPVVFVGSHPHNSNVQLIEDKSRYKVYREKPFPWVLVKTCNYGESRLKRVFSMLQFYFNGKKAAKHFEKPDAIVGSTPHPLSAVLAIRLARKLHTKSIVEVRDLWPEDFIQLNVAGRMSPIVIVLRMIEKWIYKNADAIVFTAGGFNDYIKDKGWVKIVPPEKVYSINNGVDFDDWNENLSKYRTEDKDLSDPDTFKIIYSGSIRLANNIGLVLDAAKRIQDSRIRILIFGTGGDLNELQKRAADEGINNVVFKGHVDKKYVPYILSCGDLMLMHITPVKLHMYGISPNKLFDYLAAGKPVLSDFPSRYNPATDNGAGITIDDPTPENVAKAMEYFAALGRDEYDRYCASAEKTALDYSFENHAKVLADIVKKLNRD